MKKTMDKLAQSEHFTVEDISDSASELDDIRDSTQPMIIVPDDDDIEMTMDVDSPPMTDSDTTPQPDDANEDEDEDDEDVDYVLDAGLFTLSPDIVAAIRICIRDASLPTCINRPPTNLGEKSHGSLTAHTYLVIFSIILPLVLPKLWYQGTPTERKQLLHLYLLVAARILSADIQLQHQRPIPFIHSIFSTDNLRKNYFLMHILFPIIILLCIMLI